MIPTAFSFAAVPNSYAVFIPIDPHPSWHVITFCLVATEHWSDLQVQTVCTIIGLSSGTCFLSDDLTRLRAHADRRLAMVRKILPPSTTVFGKITASELMKQELPNHFACYPTISKASGVGGNACAGQQSTTAVHALINWTARTAPATAAAASGIGCSADTTHRLDKGKPQRRRPNGAASLPSAQHYFDVWNERLLLETDLAKLALGPYQTLALQVPFSYSELYHLGKCVFGPRL
eukprot:SAG31_NODE_772_length_12197_cov_7.075963_14_plen_235_part_00